jgi:hypothetical protein
MSDNIDSYIPGVEAGQGVNLALKTTHGVAIKDRDLKPPIPPATGVDSEWYLAVIDSSESLMSAFSLSGKISYSGLFSASAAAEFLSQSNFSRYHTYVLARCIVGAPDQIISDPQIKDTVLAEAKTMTKEAFNQVYGTEFLKGVQLGGYYYGVIEIESVSSEEQQQIAVAVSGSGWGVSVDVTVSQKLAKATENRSKKVFAIRNGGPKTLKNPLTPDDIIQQAAGFPELATDAPKTIRGIYQPYDQMAKIQYKDPGGEFDWDKRQSDLQALGRRYLKLKQLRNDFNFVIDHYNDYITGGGVVFEFSGQVLENQPLSSVQPNQNMRVETDSDIDADKLPSSSEANMDVIVKELSSIENKLIEIVEAADKCKLGKVYAMPEPYLAKIALPKLKGKNMELELIKKQLVPSGTIAMWSGPANAVPEGWLICDGTKGTPDLRERFIRGAAIDKDPLPGSSGGPDEHTHYLDPPSTSFTTNHTGQHTHGFPLIWYNRNFDDGACTGIDTHDTDVTKARTQEDGGHSHNGTIDIGGFYTQEYKVEIKPRWYALCFIKKE